MSDLKQSIRQMVPASVLQRLLPPYHLALAYTSAFTFNFPSKKLRVIAVTGTKGKSSTTEFINSIFEESGERTAVMNSIRFKIASQVWRNDMRMSMPGR